MSLPDLDLAGLFYEAFDEEVNQKIADSQTDPSTWKAGGKVSKKYPNKEDEKWWRDYGPTFVQAYADWRESVPWQIWTTPAGEPAIELELFATFGEVPVRMFIDRIFVTQYGELAVVDLKTGASPPKDQGLQLGFYASGIEEVFGVRPGVACYWNARTGGVTPPYDIDHLTPAFLGQLLGEFVRARESGLFIPNLSMGCGNCGVKRACAAVGGAEAKKYDPLYLEPT